MKNKFQIWLKTYIISFILLSLYIGGLITTFRLAYGVGEYAIECQRLPITNEVICSYFETSYWGLVHTDKIYFSDIKSAKVNFQEEWRDGSRYVKYWLTVTSEGQEVDFIDVPPPVYPFFIERIRQGSDELGSVSDLINDFIASDKNSLSFTILKDKYYLKYLISAFTVLVYIHYSFMTIRALKNRGNMENNG